MTVLTDLEKEEIHARAVRVHQLLPELVPVIKELSDLGMIPGWRCVRRVRAFTDPEWPPERAVPAVTSHAFFVSPSKESP